VKRNKGELLQQARDYAFLLLKFRLRSEKELYERLKKKFDEAIAQKTVSFLKDKGFLDDDLFARNLIESRLKHSQGLRKIKEELKLKGIDQSIITAHFDRLKAGYCEEVSIAEILKERFKKLKGVEPQAVKRRLYGYLARRGFSPDLILEAINQHYKHNQI